ncbi:unnamed protein product [Closterium sp. NIES-54]
MDGIYPPSAQICPPSAQIRSPRAQICNSSAHIYSSRTQIYSRAQIYFSCTQICTFRYQICILRVQICTPRDQICPPRDQICIPRIQICTPLDQICIQRDQICTQRDQICIPRIQICALRSQICIPRDQICTFRAQIHSSCARICHRAALLVPTHSSIISGICSDANSSTLPPASPITLLPPPPPPPSPTFRSSLPPPILPAAGPAAAAAAGPAAAPAAGSAAAPAAGPAAAPAAGPAAAPAAGPAAAPAAGPAAAPAAGPAAAPVAGPAAPPATVPSPHPPPALVSTHPRGGLQPVAPTAPTGPVPTHPDAEPSPPGDPPTFAPNVNDPQSSETAICTYRTNLQEHLRQQLRYEDEKRIYDDVAARYSKYQEDLDTYTADLADCTTKITAWRVADRRALAILLATVPSSLKRELSPTSSSHVWRLLVDLSDEWFARGNTGTPPRWPALKPRPTPLEVRSSPLYEPSSSTQAHQTLAPPQQQQQQQQQLGSQQQGLQQYGQQLLLSQLQQQLQHLQQQGLQQYGQQLLLSQLQQQLQHLQQQLDLQPQLPLLPPPPVSRQQPFPTWTARSAASAAHLSGASPAPGATDTVLRDAGTLCPLPTPTSLLGAESSFSIPCHNTSTLPCPLYPSGTITGLHIPSLCTNLLSQRSLQQANITTVFPGGANYCALYNTATGRLLSRIPLCPRSRLYTLRLPRPPTCQVASPSLLPPPPLPPTNPPLPPRPRDSDCSCRSLSHSTILLHHKLGHPKFATLRSSVSSGLLHGPPSSLPPLPKSPAPPLHCLRS